CSRPRGRRASARCRPRSPRPSSASSESSGFELLALSANRSFVRYAFLRRTVPYQGRRGWLKSVHLSLKRVFENGSETVDLGIKGRRAIVCASSKGLGRACAMALANEGVHVTVTARGAEALAKTAADIRKAHPDVTVTEIVGDITTPAGREAVLKACPD